jgi:hypothetical protein
VAEIGPRRLQRGYEPEDNPRGYGYKQREAQHRFVYGNFIQARRARGAESDHHID